MSPAFPLGSGDRILLVDDSEADNVYHEAILRFAGHAGDIRVFEEPLLALAYLERLPDGPVSLVLLDINMPGMSGFEFAVASQPLLAARPSVVLVMLTSSGAEEDRRRAAALPAISGFITKPLSLEGARELLAGRWPSLAV